VEQIDGPPTFHKVDITPFAIGHPDQKVAFPHETNLNHASNLRNSPLPAGITQQLVDNPNVLLTDRLAHQDVQHTTVLHISSGAIDGGGLRDIPFLGPNAAAHHLTATFRIETVKHPQGGTFLQLQYTQQLDLDFAGLSWPHVTVANLVLTGA
jgi:hypothetical protein